MPIFTLQSISAAADFSSITTLSRSASTSNNNETINFLHRQFNCFTNDHVSQAASGQSLFVENVSVCGIAAFSPCVCSFVAVYAQWPVTMKPTLMTLHYVKNYPAKEQKALFLVLFLLVQQSPNKTKQNLEPLQLLHLKSF